MRGGLWLAKTVELALIVLLLIQGVLTVLIWLVNPIIVTQQTIAAGYIASSLVMLSIVSYVYYKSEDYDQEWIALGVGMVVLILLLTYLKGGVV